LRWSNEVRDWGQFAVWIYERKSEPTDEVPGKGKAAVSPIISPDFQGE